MHDTTAHSHSRAAHGAIPELMRSCRYHGVRKAMTVDTVPVPVIGEGDALVRIVASGVCRSDWHLWNGDWGWLGLKLPECTTLGHEIGGVIAKIGPGVSRVAPGMRVTVPFNLACGFCDYCRQGVQNMCDNHQNPMLIEGGGGWQQYVRVPIADMNCIPLPEKVDEVAAAALGCRYMTAWRAMSDRAQVRGGEFVAVHGCGGVGLAAIQIAAAVGGRPIAIDIDDEKLVTAKQAGACATLNARGLSPTEVGQAVKQLTGGPGTEVAIDALGGTAPMLGGLFSLRKGGRLVQVGMSGAAEKGIISLPVDLMVLHELSIIGSAGNPHSAYPLLLRMVAAGKLDPVSLVSRRIGLDEVQNVLYDMDQFKVSGYAIITKF